MVRKRQPFVVSQRDVIVPSLIHDRDVHLAVCPFRFDTPAIHMVPDIDRDDDISALLELLAQGLDHARYLRCPIQVTVDVVSV